MLHESMMEVQRDYEKLKNIYTEKHITKNFLSNC